MDLTLTVDDFREWFVVPAVEGALCYAENGNGESYPVPRGVYGSIAEYDGVRVRLIQEYSPLIDKQKFCMDIRYQPAA